MRRRPARPSTWSRATTALRRSAATARSRAAITRAGPLSRALPDVAALKSVGRLTSDWLIVDQARIDRFAEATGDHQFIHVDPVLAATTPFGGTIAHGLLTLSLLPAFAYVTLPPVETRRMSVNYGYDRIRFLAPVRSGKRVRAHFEPVDVIPRGPGCWQVTLDATIEIEGEAKPALTARSISLTYTD